MRELSELTKFTKEERKAYASALERYGSKDDVTGVDIGYKYKGGEKTETVAIRIHVKEKKDKHALEAAEVFPESIKGVPVDVIQAVYKPNGLVGGPGGRTARFDVLQPGISASHYRGSAGTIGLIVNDKVRDKPAILSNWHILCVDNNAGQGDPIVQPSSLDGGKVSNDTVALLERMVLNEDGDAAIALLNEERQWGETQYDTGIKITGDRDPQLGEILEKSGRTTGVTFGRVDGIGCFFLDYPSPFGRVGIDGFKLVARTPGNPNNEEISAGGDSGSVWYDPDTKEGVGLHFAGEISTSPQGEHAIACFLTRVFTALNISIPALNISKTAQPILDRIEIKNQFTDPARNINVKVCGLTASPTLIGPGNIRSIRVSGDIEISVDTPVLTIPNATHELKRDYWIKLHQVPDYELLLNGKAVINGIKRSNFDTTINFSKGQPEWTLKVKFPPGLSLQQTKNVTVGDG